MDRLTWINERKRISEYRYDTLHSFDYDKNWGYIYSSHRSFLMKFLSLLPPKSYVLDAACGTGKYWSIILDSGHILEGIDQSQGMLTNAHKKFPDVSIRKLSLQNMDYYQIFDGLICIDAMENVFPEHWPLVLQNFNRAIKDSGYIYLTVELIAKSELDEEYRLGQKAGLPIVYGEHNQEGGYHYYPSLVQVRTWIQETHFIIVEEATGDDYQHILLQKKD